jgi:hypothetical protein
MQNGSPVHAEVRLYLQGMHLLLLLSPHLLTRIMYDIVDTVIRQPVQLL